MTLYDEIKVFDKDLADTYQKSLNKSGELDKNGVEAIFVTALGGDINISVSEFTALILIKNKANISKDGLEEWSKLVIEAIVMEGIGKGLGRELTTAQDLNEVFNAIATATTINFTGPKTRITYDARQYLAMKKLIIQKKLHVFDMSGMPMYSGIAAAAWYDKRLDCLFLLDGAAAGRTQVIAHELAHAIQDWNDIKTKTDYAEADAYIVQGLVERKLKVPVNTQWPFFDAVEMVLAGKAKVNNPDWNNAKPGNLGVYDKAAAQLRTYSDPHLDLAAIYKNKPVDDDFTEEEDPNKPEKVELAALLKEVDGDIKKGNGAKK